MDSPGRIAHCSVAGNDSEHYSSSKKQRSIDVVKGILRNASTGLRIAIQGISEGAGW